MFILFSTLVHNCNVVKYHTLFFNVHHFERWILLENDQLYHNRESSVRHESLFWDKKATLIYDYNTFATCLYTYFRYIFVLVEIVVPNSDNTFKWPGDCTLLQKITWRLLDLQIIHFARGLSQNLSDTYQSYKCLKDHILEKIIY